MTLVVSSQCLQYFRSESLPIGGIARGVFNRKLGDNPGKAPAVDLFQEKALVPQSSFVAAAVKAGIFAVDAVLLKNSGTKSFTSDAVLKRTIEPTGFPVQAEKKVTREGSFKADAVLKRAMESSTKADSVLTRTMTGSTTADAIVAKTQSGNFGIAAILKRTLESSAKADAIVKRTQEGSLTSDAVIQAALAGSFPVDANIFGSVSSSFSVQYQWFIGAEPVDGDFPVVAAIIEWGLWSETWENPISSSVIEFTHVDAVITKTMAGSFPVEAIFARTTSGSFAVEAVVTASITGSIPIAADIKATVSGSFALDAILQKAASGSLLAGTRWKGPSSTSDSGRSSGSFRSRCGTGSRSARRSR